MRKLVAGKGKDSDLILDDDGNIIASIHTEAHGEAAPLLRGNMATEIVRRVNAYDTLVAALKESLKMRDAAGRLFQPAVDECNRIEHVVLTALVSVGELPTKEQPKTTEGEPK